MTQNPNFNPLSKSVEPLFGSTGVMEVTGPAEYNTAITEAYFDSSAEWGGLYVVVPSGEIKYFDLDKSQVDQDAGETKSIVFQDVDGSSYFIRRVSDADGTWMSKYKTELPVEVLQKKILTDSTPAVEMLLKLDLPPVLPFFESLVFYYKEGADSVLELTYLSSAGTYFRQDATWTLSDLDSAKYDEAYVLEVDPTRASEAIDAFDEKDLLSVEDATKYSLQF